MNGALTRYRKVSEISAEEFMSALTKEPQKQHAIFVKLGGDPADPNYARLSSLTQKLRGDGVEIRSSRQRGVWLP